MLLIHSTVRFCLLIKLNAFQMLLFQSLVVFKYYSFFMNTTHIALFIHIHINSWNSQQKSLYLAASLRGQAQTVLGNMRSGVNRTYEELCEALESRFAPANQTELYRAMLREKRQRPNESLPELGECIRRLAHLAYPTAPREVTEMIAKDQFIDALTEFDMRLRI